MTPKKKVMEQGLLIVPFWLVVNYHLGGIEMMVIHLFKGDMQQTLRKDTEGTCMEHLTVTAC